jgi:hypothetical protein
MSILVVSTSGYGKDIACVLAGKALEGTIRKVEESQRKISLWSNRSRSGIARRASIAA